MKMRTPAEKAAIEQERSGRAEAMMRPLAVGDRLESVLSESEKFKDWPSSARVELARRVRRRIADRTNRFTHSNASLLHPMFATAFDPRLVEIVDKMNLEILKAPMGSLFITGDQPVIVFDPTPPTPSKPGTGLDCHDVEVTFPLSTEILLRFSWKHAPGERLISPEEVVEFNRRTVIMAKAFIFASRRDDAILELVRENHAYSAGRVFIAIPLPLGKTLALSIAVPVRPARYYRQLP
jgi:hypothetical protein